MAHVETEAIVLRSIRYGEADVVLTLYTGERGRVSAIAKGARRPRSRLGACAQPGVRVSATLREGRGALLQFQQASLLEPNAGLWAQGDRLQAAGCILETAYRVLPEEDPSPEAYALLARALGLLARAPRHEGPAHLHPIVLGVRAKLIVVSGLLPRLGPCESCAPDARLVAFGARAGGALCEECAGHGVPVSPGALEALAQLVGRPLADAVAIVSPDVAAGVEAMIVDVLADGLGVELASTAAPRPIS